MGWVATQDSEEPPNPDIKICLSAVEVGVSVHMAGCTLSEEKGGQRAFWGEHVSIWNVCPHLSLGTGFSILQ